MVVGLDGEVDKVEDGGSCNDHVRSSARSLSRIVETNNSRKGNFGLLTVQKPFYPPLSLTMGR